MAFGGMLGVSRSISSVLRCEVCRRETAQDIQTCQRDDCPYDRYEGRIVAARWLWLGATLSIAGMIGGAVGGGLGIVVMWLGAFALAAIVFVGANSRAILYNPRSGLMWHEQRLLGRVLWRFAVIDRQPITFEWEQPLSYPAAVAAAYLALSRRLPAGPVLTGPHGAGAILVVKAMLLDLLAADAIELSYLEAVAARGPSGQWQHQHRAAQYVVVPGPNANLDPPLTPMRTMMSALTDNSEHPTPRHQGFALGTLVMNALTQNATDPFEQIIATVLTESGLDPAAFADNPALVQDATQVEAAVAALAEAWPDLDRIIAQGLLWRK